MTLYFLIEYSDSKGPQSHIATRHESAIQFVSGIISAPKSDSRLITKILLVNSYLESVQILKPFIDDTMKLNFREEVTVNDPPIE